MQQASDFVEEAKQLGKLLEKQSDSVFDIVTLFKSWTINDVIGHLYMFDVAALKTLEGDKVFEDFFAPIRSGIKDGKTLLQMQKPFVGSLSGRALFKVWQKNTMAVGQAYLQVDPKQRVKWAGPDMSALSSITARQMETWAHGQEIFDALGERRLESDRIKNICHLGVVTYQWTFSNRQMAIPEPTPFIKLISPSGQLWEWNNSNSNTFVQGCAVEFAQVVTQVRSIHDTDLKVVGSSAESWMSFAQCFAGKPEIPPKKGSRYRV